MMCQTTAIRVRAQVVDYWINMQFSKVRWKLRLVRVRVAHVYVDVRGRVVVVVYM